MLKYKPKVGWEANPLILAAISEGERELGGNRPTTGPRVGNGATHSRHGRR